MNYGLCGMCVTSQLELPELAPWLGPDRAPDLEIRIGSVPLRLAGATYEGPLLQISSDGSCRLAIPGVASYLARGGRDITVQPEMDENAPDIRLFLLGTVFAFACHQRGLVPLNAGCVEIDGAAIAFSGAPGVGKSTLAAAFLRRGLRLLADDLTVIDVSAEAGPTVLPSFPRVKLWRDSQEALGWASAAGECVRSEIDKLQFPIGSGFSPAPLRLSALYHLARSREPRALEVSTLRGIDAAQALLGAVYRHQRAFQMGYAKALTSAVFRMAPVPNLSLAWGSDLSRVDELVDCIVSRQSQ